MTWDSLAPCLLRPLKILRDRDKLSLAAGGRTAPIVFSDERLRAGLAVDRAMLAKEPAWLKSCKEDIKMFYRGGARSRQDDEAMAMKR